jgi:hypothetical protein
MIHRKQLVFLRSKTGRTATCTPTLCGDLRSHKRKILVATILKARWHQCEMSFRDVIQTRPMSLRRALSRLLPRLRPPSPRVRSYAILGLRSNALR